MEVWQIELLKIGGTALIAFSGGLGGYWLYLRKRKVENTPDKEKLQETEKLTTLFIEHRKHNISPTELLEFKRKILSRVAEGDIGLRSMREILEAEEEFFDKVWYGRHKSLELMVESGRKEVDPKIWQGALKAAKKVESKYGKKQLGPRDDFEWGMLNGKLSALRWASGDEWDMLDT
ncbi:MAG: hypothetical protein Q7R34_13260 [Dehalococcoidia bacterium]|nr:hypothetical protein [Dehalococcoidia bacterium]